jgi:hypothetical protein
MREAHHRTDRTMPDRPEHTASHSVILVTAGLNPSPSAPPRGLWGLTPSPNQGPEQ